nr:MAG TPA: hypothetical protein [Caudoviricetes sp.]
MGGFEPPQYLFGTHSLADYTQLPVSTSRNRPFICVLSVLSHFS